MRWDTRIPHLVAALEAQAQKAVARVQPVPDPGRRAAAQRLCAATFADFVFFCNSGAEAMECAIKVARKYQSASGRPERYRIITFEGAFHGRTLATLAAGGQKKYLEGFGPVVQGFDQVPFGDLEAVKRAIGPETAAILIEPIQGEGGVRVVEPVPQGAARAVRPARPAPDLRRGADRHGPHRRAVRLPALRRHARHHGARQGAGRRVPGRRLPRDARGGQGHDRRHPRLDLRRQSAGHGAGNAVLDVVLAPGFFDKVQRSAPVQAAACRDQGPLSGVIAEVRGEGLLVGLRALVPTGELVDALRAEKMLTVAAGDNVVRLLPPLIVSEQEIAEGITRLDRACAQLNQAHARRQKQEAAG